MHASCIRVWTVDQNIDGSMDYLKVAIISDEIDLSTKDATEIG